MTQQLARRLIALVGALFALATYLLTLAPSIGFWRSPELAAAAWWQQIPQPIVGPLWLILARVMQTIAPGSPALGANFLSAFTSAATAGLVAAIVARIVERWTRGADEHGPVNLPAIVGGLIASLTFAWSDTQWSVSTGAAVEPLGLLLCATALYLALVWDASPDAPGADQWLLAIAYVLGLTAGVDARFLLVAPAIALIVFQRRFAYTVSTTATLLIVLTAGWYLYVDGLLREWLPAVIDGVDWLTIVGLPALVLAAWLAWRSQEQRRSAAAMTLAMCLIGVLGATTVVYLPIRSAANPRANAIDERSSEPTALYLRLTGAEEQVPLWPRRSPSPDDSTASFAREIEHLVDYQSGRMFLRYVLWNYVGRSGDLPGASAALLGDASSGAFDLAPTGADEFPIRLYALPLLLAVAGMLVLFARDWRMGLAVLVAFLAMGFGLVIVANLQEPQVRERDEFFVGAMLVMAVWSGVGAAGLASALRGATGRHRVGAAVVAGAICLTSPLLMLLGGWTVHERSTDLVAWDYAYNLLQSCERDAILLTGGDNDTFPLQYLQDVDGVRRDVRIVNLALANDRSELERLRTERVWGAAPLPIGPIDSLAGDALVRVGMPETVSVPVPGVRDRGTRRGRARRAADSAMTWMLRGPAVGDGGMQMIRPQERMIVALLRGNAWRRPVYFSSGVHEQDRAGLGDHLERSGLALRIVSARRERVMRGEVLDVERMRTMLIHLRSGEDFERGVSPRFRFRGLRAGGGYLLREARGVIGAYRYLYLLLAEHELNEAGNPTAARAVLDQMETSFPSSRHPMPYWMHATLASLRERTGDEAGAEQHARAAIDAVDAMGDRWRSHPLAGTYHPMEVKVRMLTVLGDFDRAVGTYEELRRRFPRDHHLRAQAEELRVQRHLRLRDTAAAVRELDGIITGYGGATEPALRNNAAAFESVREELSGRSRATSEP